MVNDVVQKHGPRLAGNIRCTFLGVIGESDPMKTMTVIAAGSALALSLTLAGCGSDKKPRHQSSSPTSASTTATSTNIAMPPERPKFEGANKTINDYIVENKIAETPFKPDEPGTPNFDFPFPPGWSPLATRHRSGPTARSSTTSLKIRPTADDDRHRVEADRKRRRRKGSEYAPGAIQNLPGYQSVYEPNKTTLGGFEAIQSAGTFVEEGARVVAQKTVVVPGKDALFVLQLNAVAPDGQQDVILDAAKLIDEQTKITPNPRLENHPNEDPIQDSRVVDGVCMRRNVRRRPAGGRSVRIRRLPGWAGTGPDHRIVLEQQLARHGLELRHLPPRPPGPLPWAPAEPAGAGRRAEPVASGGSGSHLVAVIADFRKSDTPGG